MADRSRHTAARETQTAIATLSLWQIFGLAGLFLATAAIFVFVLMQLEP
jgi:hypothetical protein